MYEMIDSTPYGNIQWESFTIHYNSANDPPSNEAPAVWKTAEYDSWFHNPHKLIQNIITNWSFNKEFNYSPYQEYDIKGWHQFHNLFSRNWCWWEAVSEFYMFIIGLIDEHPHQILLYPSIFTFPLLPLPHQSTAMYPCTDTTTHDHTHTCFIGPISLIWWTHVLQFTCFISILSIPNVQPPTVWPIMNPHTAQSGTFYSFTSDEPYAHFLVTICI